MHSVAEARGCIACTAGPATKACTACLACAVGNHNARSTRHAERGRELTTAQHGQRGRQPSMRSNHVGCAQHKACTACTACAATETCITQGSPHADAKAPKLPPPRAAIQGDTNGNREGAESPFHNRPMPNNQIATAACGISVGRFGARRSGSRLRG